MDKIEKALGKLTPKERKRVKEILLEIEGSGFKNLNLKKLKGKNNIFRARKGEVRIIFQKKDTSLKILTIERRSSKTYRKR